MLVFCNPVLGDLILGLKLMDLDFPCLKIGLFL